MREYLVVDKQVIIRLIKWEGNLKSVSASSMKAYSTMS